RFSSKMPKSLFLCWPLRGSPRSRKEKHLLIHILLIEICIRHLQPLRCTVYDRKNSRLAQGWLAGRVTRTQHLRPKVVGFFVSFPIPPALGVQSMASRNGAQRNGKPEVKSQSSDLVMRRILRCLTAVQNGNFSVRMPSEWTGLEGKVTDALNEIIAANERMA